MNEEQKNIETCLPENILAEVANVPTDPQFRSLVNESLDPLKQQELQQAGYDGYEKVVWTHKPYTFTSQVKQMKSNLILLLRRLWRYPFGGGNTASAAGSSAAGSSAASAAGSSAASAAAPIRSLADMWQHYITRLKGNPEYGIPSRLSQLSDLPDAPALLADRKISGVPEAADGMSVVQMLCCSSTSAEVTELTDNTTWDLLNRSLSFLKSYFPNLDKLTIGCQRCTVDVGSIPRETVFTNLQTISLINKSENPSMAWAYTSGDLHLPALKSFYANQRGHLVSDDSVHGDFIAEEVETIDTGYNPEFFDTTDLVRVYAPKLKRLTGGIWKQEKNFGLTQEISKDDFTTIIVGYGSVFNNANYIYGRTNVIHIEFRVIADTSVNLASWSPTNALDASRTDLIEEGSTATNNLHQFLSNFKKYIANRLTDNGSGLTLTLSQEVRNAIHAAEATYGIENIIITKKGWTISPAPN